MREPIDRPKRRIWLRALFAVSLALNLLVVGLATGAVLRHGGLRDGAEGRRPPPSLGAVMYRALPRDERHALREASVEGGDGARVKASRGDSVARMVSLLRAPDFDDVAVSQILAEERMRREDWADRAESNLMRVVAGMSAAERQAFADRMEDVAHKRGKKFEK